jgi:NADPH:quinone reductase-like Zn-dependent oxidoreductase
MIARFGAKRGLTVINIVRRAAQADDLRAKGAEYVFDSSEPDFDKALRDTCRTLDARVAFDAVGGQMTDKVLRAMPNGSRVIVYGGLSGEPTTIGVDQFVFRDKHVDGFWLSTWMRAAPAEVGSAWREVQASHADFKSEVRARYPLDQFGDALKVYEAQMSGGKVLITP